MRARGREARGAWRRFDARRLWRVWALVLLLAGLTAPAAAQGALEAQTLEVPIAPRVEAAMRSALEAPNMRATILELDRRCPGLVKDDHAFTDAAASVLHAIDRRWGRNGKRGNTGDPSHDAIAWQNPASPAGGVSIVDIIVAAGDPSRARADWADVTALTLERGTVGAFVQPSGRIPACYGGTPAPVDPDPDVTPAPGGDGVPVLPVSIDVRLERLLEGQRVILVGLESLGARVAALEGGDAVTRAALEDYAARLETLIDRQTRRIFGELVEGDGTQPAGVAEDAIRRLYERAAAGDRLRVRAW